MQTNNLMIIIYVNIQFIMYKCYTFKQLKAKIKILLLKKYLADDVELKF